MEEESALVEVGFVGDAVLVVFVFAFSFSSFFFAFFIFVFFLFFFFLESFVFFGIHFEAEVYNQHGSVLYFPEFMSVRTGDGEGPDEGDPVVDRDPHKLTQIGVQDILKTGYYALQRTRLVGLLIGLEEVVVLTQLVLDFTYQVRSRHYINMF